MKEPEGSDDAFAKLRQAEEYFFEEIMPNCPMPDIECRLCYFGGALATERMACPILNDAVQDKPVEEPAAADVLTGRALMEKLAANNPQVWPRT